VSTKGWLDRFPPNQRIDLPASPRRIRAENSNASPAHALSCCHALRFSVGDVQVRKQPNRAQSRLSPQREMLAARS
jgi:hypothetical protein